MLGNPGLYVHLPWCIKKCPYCDFNSHPLREDSDFSRYHEQLVNDWHAQSASLNPQQNIRSIFFGGGTPSLFPAHYFASLLALIPGKENAEITMEANPGTTEHLSFDSYRQAGINRLSIGAQTFNDKHLQSLGRIHSADETTLAFQAARAGGYDNINIDLMWGLPGQSVAEALNDLHQAIELEPEHLSWYQLTIEAKTEFAKRTPILPTESILGDIEQEGLAVLAEAGYVRYEVSAFAKPTRECQHNLNYWRFGDYLGVGAGAHGKVTQTTQAAQDTMAVQHIVRTQQASQPRLYQSAPALCTVVQIAEDDLVAEFMLNALRLVEGVEFSQFESTTGLAWSSVESQWHNLVSQDLVRTDRCATTALGLRYLDTVVASFL